MRLNDVVCFSGAISDEVACGPVIGRSWRITDTESVFNAGGYWVKFPEGRRPVGGDSGSPVWMRRGGRSVGLVTAGRPREEEEPRQTLIEPLLHPPNLEAPKIRGILHHPNMEPLQLKLGP